MQLPRRKQREILLQLLFSYEVSRDVSTEDCAPILMELLAVSKKNIFEMDAKFQEIIKVLDQIDPLLEKSSLEYSIERISLIDKNILRIGIFEVLFEKQEPAIAIEEALRLSKKFSSEDAVSYVHAIMCEVLKNGTVTT